MTNLLKACLDWRVITALTAVGVGIYLLAPNLIAAALPLLLVAVCPLSMLLMMKTMRGQETNAGPAIARIPAERAERLRAELAASMREQQRLVRELEQLDAGATAPVNAPSSSPRA